MGILGKIAFLILFLVCDVALAQMECCTQTGWIGYCQGQNCQARTIRRGVNGLVQYAGSCTATTANQCRSQNSAAAQPPGAECTTANNEVGIFESGTCVKACSYQYADQNMQFGGAGVRYYASCTRQATLECGGENGRDCNVVYPGAQNTQSPTTPPPPNGGSGDDGEDPLGRPAFPTNSNTSNVPPLPPIPGGSVSNPYGISETITRPVVPGGNYSGTPGSDYPNAAAELNSTTRGLSGETVPGSGAAQNGYPDLDADPANIPRGFQSGEGNASVGGNPDIPQAQAVLPPDPTVRQAITTLSTTGKTCQTAMAAIETCSGAADKAMFLCREDTSPNIVAGIKYAGTFLGIIQQARGANAACSKMGEFLKVMQGFSAAYNVACGAAKIYCENTCKTAQAAATSGIPAAGVTAGVTNSGCKPAATAATRVNVDCTKYGMNLANGAITLATLIAQGKQAKACQNNTETNCTKTPLDPKCVATTDCNSPANANSPTCICIKNPRQAGCSPPGVITPDRPVAGIRTTIPNVNDPDGSGGGGPGPSMSGGGAGSAGGGPTGGGGGGGGGLGSGSGGGKGADTGKGTAKSGLNTNINSGDYGGGGGGRGGGGAGGGSAVDPATYAKYKNYMPGGENDPSRAAASVGGANQITGGGGKSNWQKVRERYLDNRGRMIGGYQ